MMEILLRSEEETERVAGEVGRMLEAGDVIGLEGDLGSGKTTFARGAIRALGVGSHERITSPTFALIHEYVGALPIVHADFYRLVDESELDELGIDELLGSRVVAFVEWGRKFVQFARAVTLWVDLTIVSDTERRLHLHANDPRGRAILDALQEGFSTASANPVAGR